MPSFVSESLYAGAEADEMPPDWGREFNLGLAALRWLALAENYTVRTVVACGTSKGNLRERNILDPVFQGL
jgi:hypothetical protein